MFVFVFFWLGAAYLAGFSQKQHMPQAQARQDLQNAPESATVVPSDARNRTHGRASLALAVQHRAPSRFSSSPRPPTEKKAPLRSGVPSTALCPSPTHEPPVTGRIVPPAKDMSSLVPVNAISFGTVFADITKLKILR